MTNEQCHQHLIDRSTVELYEANFYLDFYKREMRNPKTVGVAQARESVEIWEKRIETIKNHMKLLQDYFKRQNGQR